MPRYFFHVRGTRPYQDDGGVDLTDDAVAWNEAKRFARDIESNLQPADSWQLEVHRDGGPIYFLTINASEGALRSGMGYNEACSAIASICREQAGADPAHRDFWRSESEDWSARSQDGKPNAAVTHEVSEGRLIPKQAKDEKKP
ncbi:hypothetical protein ABIB00_003907 [Bradyrhizobium sp. LB14.3]|uniref:DUF6894 family protein n=1 Tax=Bradyrhizobium sp. LB14.3 TaxID=3156328 RepID=UPI00339566F9